MGMSLKDAVNTLEDSSYSDLRLLAAATFFGGLALYTGKYARRWGRRGLEIASDDVFFPEEKVMYTAPRFVGAAASSVATIGLGAVALTFSLALAKRGVDKAATKAKALVA